MRIGEPVELYSTFDGSWIGGFQLVGTAQSDGGEFAFVVRRSSDGMVLPTRFLRQDIRLEDEAATGEQWPHPHAASSHPAPRLVSEAAEVTDEGFRSLEAASAQASPYMDGSEATALDHVRVE